MYRTGCSRVPIHTLRGHFARRHGGWRRFRPRRWPRRRRSARASRTSKRLPAPAQGAGWTISQENPAWLQGGLGIRHVGGAHHPARCRHAGDCATFLLARFWQPRTRTDMLQRSRGVCSHTAHNPGCKMLEALPAVLRCSPSPRGRDRPESARCWCAACWCRTCQVPGFADLASRAALQPLALPLRPRDCSMHSRQLLLLL